MESILIEFDKVCLICLEKREQLQCVYKSDEQTPNIQIIKKILNCSVLQNPKKFNNFKLPNKICRCCLDDLTVAYRFWQKCVHVNTVFAKLQRQDEEAEARTNLELKEQNINLPSGIKIKRIIKAEHETYLVPIKAEIEEKFKPLEVLEDDAPNSEDGSAIESTANVDENDDTDIIEQIDFEEYVVSQDEMESLDNAIETEESPESLLDEAQNDVKDNIIDNIIFDNEDQKIHELQKRRRGRPKKLSIYTDDASDSLTVDESSEIMPMKKSRTNVTSKAGSSKNTNDPIGNLQKSGITIKSVRTRKRKVINTESRPSKICEICGNNYKYQHALNAHMRRHTNDKPFACECCDKAFVSGVELKRHMRVHTGQKPYSCQYCQRSFSDFGSKTKHERTHTGERPYRCNTCGKCFAYAHVLSVHVRTHTGEKRFCCTRCGKGFTKKAYLKTHMEQHGNSLASMLNSTNIVQQSKFFIKSEESNSTKTLPYEEYTTEYIIDEDINNFEMLITKSEENDEILTEERLVDTEDDEYFFEEANS